MTAIEMRLCGRAYKVDCLSGQEARLERVARLVEEAAEALGESGAAAAEAGDDEAERRFLAMAALVLADKLAEAEDALERREAAADAVELAPPTDGALSPELAAALSSALIAAAERMEQMAARLEAA